MTVLLSRSDLISLLDVDTCIQGLRNGFLEAPAVVDAQRVRSGLPGPGTATVLIPGLVTNIPAYTVKTNAKFPAARPALRGVVCLHDAANGELLAVLDSATVTAWRTGLAAAIGTDVLARASAGSLAVIGAGAQAELVLRGLTALRPIHRLVVCDLDPVRARSFAERHGTGRLVEIAADARTAAREADIVILATWSRDPLLDVGDVDPGTHITSLGADEPGKAELSAELLRSAHIVVDDTRLAVSSGALGTAGLCEADAAGELGEILAGRDAGRTSEAEVTVYTPVGLPWQDLALSWIAYQRAVQTDVGQRFDFLT
ncbi:ornithine cyclodeaminase family protein [Kribbella pittospori]|uniref:Ornithine cyclodeaminase family protein n=1 Tax=Kribbella pittospori TaxID=722689 RepID=A0A4R0K348_9ACTN|nr:ornithine cyclodeaminase family protein [Kribbella pittospori]TCC54413.1 ornithine cyclodeaminase family protein [Kribbella pittospori]